MLRKTQVFAGMAAEKSAKRKRLAKSPAVPRASSWILPVSTTAAVTAATNPATAVEAAAATHAAAMEAAAATTTAVEATTATDVAAVKATSATSAYPRETPPPANGCPATRIAGRATSKAVTSPGIAYRRRDSLRHRDSLLRRSIHPGHSTRRDHSSRRDPSSRDTTGLRR